MSVAPPPDLPSGDAPARARAKESIWRLAALAFGHPTPDLQAAIASGRFAEAFGTAWAHVTGKPWPAPPPSPDFAALEAGYIATFLHGRAGKPAAPLLAGDYETLLAGLSRPVFMLNIAGFYRHFGLRAASADEGRADEPDHLASMLEFMAVLASLEAGALARGRDPGPARRAQRDFLGRYLARFLEAVASRTVAADDLDPTLRQLCADLPNWAVTQLAELSARVGPFRDLDRAPAVPEPVAAEQNLWG